MPYESAGGAGRVAVRYGQTLCYGGDGGLPRHERAVGKTLYAAVLPCTCRRLQEIARRKYITLYLLTLYLSATQNTYGCNLCLLLGVVTRATCCCGDTPRGGISFCFAAAARRRMFSKLLRFLLGDWAKGKEYSGMLHLRASFGGHNILCCVFISIFCQHSVFSFPLLKYLHSRTWYGILRRGLGLRAETCPPAVFSAF